MCPETMPWEDSYDASPSVSYTAPWEDDYDVADAAPLKSSDGAFLRGVAGGIKGSGESLGSALEGAGQLSGIKEIEGAGTALSKFSKDARQADTQRTIPTVQDLWKDFSLDNLLTFTGESVGQGAASSLLPLAGGAAGTIVGGPIGGAAGLLAGSLPLNYGDIRSQLIEEGVKPELANEYGAYATLPISALDTFSGGKLLDSVGKKAIKDAGIKALAKYIAKEGAEGLTREGATEALQQGIQEYTVANLSGNPDLQKRLNSVLDAGVQGALSGGVTQGALGLTGKPKEETLFAQDEEPPIQEQEMPTSEQLLLEAPRGEIIDVTPEGEASTKTERDALALRALPAPKQDSGVFIDHPERGMVQLTQAQADRLRERLQEMQDNGLTPDVLAAQRNRGTGTEPAVDVKALPAPSIIPNVFIGGKEGLKPATTADIIPQPESGQITPQVYRFGKSGEALESEPVVGQGYNKITLPNGDNVAAIVTAIGKDGRAVITTDDGRKLRPLVSKTKFYAEPKVIEPTRQEFRLESFAPAPVLAQESYKGPSIEQIDSAATETHTQPTQAQKEAGNYTKGQVNWNGLNISIENPRGSERSGVDKNGKAWSVTMPDHYGYIKQTEGRDGDHLDIYMGKKPDSNNVYVIDQVNTENGKFDEHKIMVGYPNKKAALTAYQRAFSDGKANERIGSVTELTVPALKNWMEHGDTKWAIAKQIKPSQNLIEFIASKGGISSSDLLVGDLKAMDLHKVFVPRMGKLINKNGLPLDQLRQMAIESGYLKDTDNGLGEAQSTIDDFLQLLSKGKKVYSANDIERQLDYENLQNSQSEDVFDEEYKNQYKAEQAAADEREYYASRDEAVVREKGNMYGLSFNEGVTVDDMNNAIAEVENSFKFQKLEPTPIGEQFIIDGTEKSAKQLAQAKEETNKGFIAPKAAQKPADIGLFKAAAAREKSEREPTLFRTNEPTDKVRFNFLKAMSANDAAIQKQLSDYVDKVYGKGVGAKLVESLSSEGTGETTGAFSPKTKLAYIALNDSKGVRNLRDILNTTRHEVIHALRNSNAIPAKDWQILEQAAKQRWMKRYGIDKAYSNLDENQKLEEAIAEAMADRQNIKEGPVIKRILESLSNFFGKVKNFFDKQEFRSSEDIFKDVENGKFAPAKAESEFNSRVQENVVSLSGLTNEEFVEQASAFLQRSKQSETEPLKRLNDMNWWTRTIVTPRTIASKFKEATPLVDAAERMMERSSTIVNQLHDSMEPYFALELDAQKKLNRWFEYARIKGIEKYTGSVINDVKETKPYYDDKGEYHVPPTLSKNGEVITLNKEEATAANAVHKGFERAADMWRDMTLEENGFTKQGDPKTYAELNAYMEASKAGRKGTTPKEVARLTQEVRKADYAMRGLQEAEALRKGYVPFVRRGKFGVSVYDKENRRLEFRRFDEKEAKKNMDELRSKYPLSKGYRIGEPSEIASYKANVQPGLFGVLDDISHMSGLNDEQHAALRDNLEKRMSQQGFRRHRIASDNIAGYSTDFHIAIPEYITGVSNYISKRVYKPKMDKAVGAMTRKPNLHKWGQDYVSYVMSPQEEMQKVRYLASLYYLSTNPSSMIVNSTQPALVSLPYLSMFSNPLKAAGQIARAYKDVASMIDGGQKGSMSGVINLDKAPTDVRSELIVLRDKGSLLPLQMDEFTANSKKEGTFSSPAAEALAKYTGEPIAKVTKFLTDMYGSVEQMNRLVTGIASLRLYKADPRFADKVSKIMEKDPLFAQEGAANSAADFANWVNKETHFRYGKINRPEMGRGKIGTTALQFRSFLQNTLELLYRMHGQGREGRLALLSVYLPITIAAAGLMGLPGAQDVLNLTQYAYNTFAKEKKDFKQELRETLTNLAPWTKGEVNGIPVSYLMMNGLSPTLGSNIGSRIGMSLGLNPNVKPQDGLEYLAGFTPITDAIIGTSLRAVDLAKQGRGLEAAEVFLPSGFRNPLTALQWSKEGVRTGSGRLLRPAEDLSTSELVSKAIGFTPVKNAILGEELGAKGFAKTADTDYRSQVYGRLARTLADISKAPDAQSKQDAQQKYQSIINEIVDYNKTATKPITADQIRQSIRSRMGEEMMGAKGRKAPKPLQRRYQEIQESFGDDGEE